MSDESVCINECEYTVAHGRASSLYTRFERKSELQHQTHFCPGCGHGIAHKMVARAIDELGIQDRTVMVGPVGCSVFTYNYFDVGNIQAAHGRAPAVATAVRRSRPESIVISYQGDGDLAAIGAAEILHAANRGENITVFFINNAIYSMTGGQVAPTTLLGQKSMTTPGGRTIANEGYPMHVSELLSTLEGPTFIARVGLGDAKQILHAQRTVNKALENQVRGLGFSLVEILSPCPTIWKLDPVKAQHWVKEVMEQTYPLGVYCDRIQERTEAVAAKVAPPAAPSLEELPHLLGVVDAELPEGHAALDLPADLDLHVRIAGFGGQGVLLMGEMLAEAGLDAGLEVSWLPSYGPEIRSGTSNCHVRISRGVIDSPMVNHPNLLVAMNEPSLRKFAHMVRPGGWIFYNGEEAPRDCIPDGVQVLARPFTHVADEVGDARACNMVMLGAVLECTGALPAACVDAALRRLVRHQRWIDLDTRALLRGRESYRASREELCVKG
jgi:2-oxoisovalerate ferredoxin oxidoreductase beta subunit